MQREEAPAHGGIERLVLLEPLFRPGLLEPELENVPDPVARDDHDVFPVRPLLARAPAPVVQIPQPAGLRPAVLTLPSGPPPPQVDIIPPRPDAAIHISTTACTPRGPSCSRVALRPSQNRSSLS